MPNNFQDKLKEIRDASARRNEASHKERNLEDLQRSLKTVRAFEYRERIEKVIDDLVANFLDEAPGFVLSRGFFEGKYMLALRQDEQLLDDHARSGHYFSRVMFLLSPHSEDDSLEIQCRKTIRNRDMETQLRTGAMTSQAMAEHAAFIEEQFLSFARVYFGETPLTRPATLPTA